MAIKISISVVDKPSQKQRAPSMLERVKGWVEEIEAGFGAPECWANAKRVFNNLAQREALTSEQKQMFWLLERMFRKNGGLREDVKLSSSYPWQKEEE